MALCHPFFVLIFLYSPFTRVHGQSMSSFDKAQEATFSLELKKSNLLLKNENDSHLKILLQDYNDVLELLIDEDFDLFDKYEERAEERLNWVDDNIDKKSPWHNLVKAEIKFHWGVVNFKFNNEITSVWQINQAHSLIKENQKKHPEFTENLKTLGVFHIIIGALPDNYQWVMEKLGFKGDVNLGLEELTKCANETNFFQIESKILLTYIKAHLFNEYPQSIKTFENELGGVSYLPSNYILVSLLSNNHQTEKAIEVIQNKPVNANYPDFYFYHYKLANCYFQKGEYKNAIKEFNRFIQNYKGKNYVKGSYYKLALAHYFLGNDLAQEEAFDNIDEYGWELLDEDKYAQKFYDKGAFPNKSLAKARYFSDGGYYEEALQILQFKKEFNVEENIELNYRMARIYHLKKDIDKAREYYYKTIELSESSETNLYYAPNACLKLAELEIENENNEIAKKHLRKAIDYKNHEYENSIEMKAKSLLKKLDA